MRLRGAGHAHATNGWALEIHTHSPGELPLLDPLSAPMPTTTFTLPTLITQADADAVMFELQDLPCISNAGVDLAHHRAWAEHTRMIDPGDIAAALAEAGHEPADVETRD